MSSNQFTGLSMPVFSAFGWAGEETAVNFALSQMELFIEALYFSLPRETQAQFVSYGLDRTSQSVYLATAPEPDSGLYIAFNARPVSLEISLAITDKRALAKAYKAAEAQDETFFKLLSELDAGWKLRIQQMEYDEDSGSGTHYQDLYKDGVDAIDTENATALVSRARYLNGEDKWVAPFYVSRRTDSEKVAAMRLTIISTSAEDIENLMPLVEFLTGKVRKKKSRAKKKPKSRPAAEVAPVEKLTGSEEQFTYVSELKPMHILRGFINLTPAHWPFFALNARTETRPVTLFYGDKKDEGSSVWRLVQNDQARLVLSPTVRQWVEDNFDEDDFIQITAVKQDRENIHITLAPVD